MTSNRENVRRAAGRWAGTMYSLLLVAAVIVVIETGRRSGALVPAPFLLLFGSVAIAAGLAGLRAGIAAATLCAAFFAYSAAIQFGPTSLTGSSFTLLVGTAIAYVVAILVGDSRDRRVELTDVLQRTQTELLQARNELAAKVKRRTAELGEVSLELSTVRSQLESAIEQSPAGVAIVDTDRQLRSINRAMLALLGLDANATTEPDLRKFLSNYKLYTKNGERIEFGIGPLTDALDRGKVTENFEFRLEHADGRSSWLRGSLGPIRASDGTVTGVTAILLDVTEEKHAAAAMHNLSRQLMMVQEEERTSLAYELHDEIGQHLTALNMNLHALKNDPDNPPLLSVCISQVAELTNTVRNLSVELRPAMLDDLGLIAALRWYLGKQRERTGYHITLDADIALGTLEAELKTAFFRVVQEAVSNAVKHADCETIAVRMYNEDGSLCITITDDGQGFDTRKRGHGKPGDLRLGLLSMRERASQLDGSFHIDSEIGRGTTISACFALR